jgi:hypothetical protein
MGNTAKKVTDISEAKHSDYAVMASDDIQAVIADNLGGEQITAMDLDRIVVPSGGGTHWTIPTLEGDVEQKSIDGIIVYTRVQRVYWADPYSGSGTPPDCFSEDSINGTGNPGGECAKCPLANFGTGDNGRSQACQMRRLVFLVQPDSLLPIVVSVPPSSLNEAKKYLLRLASKGKPAYSVFSSMSLEKDKNTDGIAFSKVKFKSDGLVENIPAIQSYIASIKPHLERAAKEVDAARDEA